jgi:hypothetical protein
MQLYFFKNLFYFIYLVMAASVPKTDKTVITTADKAKNFIMSEGCSWQNKIPRENKKGKKSYTLRFIYMLLVSFDSQLA